MVTTKLKEYTQAAKRALSEAMLYASTPEQLADMDEAFKRLSAITKRLEETNR